MSAGGAWRAQDEKAQNQQELSHQSSPSIESERSAKAGEAVSAPVSNTSKFPNEKTLNPSSPIFSRIFREGADFFDGVLSRLDEKTYLVGVRYQPDAFGDPFFRRCDVLDQ